MAGPGQEPSRNEAKALWDICLTGVPAVRPIDTSLLAELSAGFTERDIDGIIENAVRHARETAAMPGSEIHGSVRGENRGALTTWDLMMAIKRRKGVPTPPEGVTVFMDEE